MTRKSGALLTFLVPVFLVVLYLLAWPVNVDPLAWQPPPDRGLVDLFAANDRLQRARPIMLGEHRGPEDIAAGPDGWLYTGTEGGDILRFDAQGGRQEVFATTGGRPLGLDFDAEGNLLVANALLGIQRITPDGRIETLLSQFEGAPLSYPNDVANHSDGGVYITDSSSKFSPRESGTYAASELDIVEHGGHGRVLRHDPAKGLTTVILDALNFPNGIALSADEQFLMLSETGSYRILRHWLAGPRSGTTETVMENLPGFPDNINNGLNDRFWVGLVVPRNRLLDDMAGRPWLRKIVQRLPAALRPKPARAAHVIAITAEGDVLMDFQDSSARLAALTGVCETSDVLWLSSLFGNAVGRLDKRDLANP